MAWYGGGKLQQFGPNGYIYVDLNPGPLFAVVDATIYSRMEAAMKLAAETARDNMQDMTPPSAPWDMPAIDSGTLKENIEYKIFDSPDRIIGAFGVFKESATNKATGKVVDMIYALYLETGTYKMDPRPWLTLTLAEVWDQWKSIFGAGGSGAETVASFSMGGREDNTALEHA